MRRWSVARAKIKTTDNLNHRFSTAFNQRKAKHLEVVLQALHQMRALLVWDEVEADLRFGNIGDRSELLRRVGRRHSAHSQHWSAPAQLKNVLQNQ